MKLHSAFIQDFYFFLLNLVLLFYSEKYFENDRTYCAT